MYFKDKLYYINKVKEYAGLLLGAVLFDAAIVIGLIIG